MSLPFPTPTSATGGCLCGDVRYEVNFSQNRDWQNASQDCQCTQCRKTSGSLAIPWHLVGSSELTWTTKSTYTEYMSSPNVYRGFCKKCGSMLVWRSEEGLWLAVGSFDEEILIGKREHDKMKGKGGFGMALYQKNNRHLYAVNEIEGVTDDFSGKRFPPGEW